MNTFSKGIYIALVLLAIGLFSAAIGILCELHIGSWAGWPGTLLVSVLLTAWVAATDDHFKTFH